MKNGVVGVRLSAALWRRVRVRAAELGVTIGAFVARALEAALKRR
jgi:hypothetical protein